MITGDEVGLETVGNGLELCVELLLVGRTEPRTGALPCFRRVAESIGINVIAQEHDSSFDSGLRRRAEFRRQRIEDQIPNRGCGRDGIGLASSGSKAILVPRLRCACRAQCRAEQRWRPEPRVSDGNTGRSIPKSNENAHADEDPCQTRPASARVAVLPFVCPDVAVEQEGYEYAQARSQGHKRNGRRS